MPAHQQRQHSLVARVLLGAQGKRLQRAGQQSTSCCVCCCAVLCCVLQMESLSNLNYDDLTAVAKLTSDPHYQSVMQVGGDCVSVCVHLVGSR